MASAITAVRAQLLAVLAQLFPAADPNLPAPPPLVSYGDPGAYLPPEVAAVMGSRTQIERPVMSTARPREEISEQDVVFSVFAEGGPEVQQPVTERAFTMLSTFADYFKTAPNETLAGTCREAWVIRYDELPELAFDQEDPPNPIGRLSTITAVLQVHARI